MSKHTLLRAATALTVAALFTACGDSNGPTDSGVSASVAAATTLDVATVAGDAAQEDVETFKVNRGAFGLATIDFERFGRWDSCPYDTAAARFICVDRTRGPFTSSRSYAYLDAAGAGQTAYSSTTTACSVSRAFERPDGRANEESTRSARGALRFPSGTRGMSSGASASGASARRSRCSAESRGSVQTLQNWA